MVPVLRTICANPHGLFWAGDTAQVRGEIIRRDLLILLQTISIGSSFRFADLKAYQHRIEVELLVISSRAEADDLPRAKFHMGWVSHPSNQGPLNLS